MSWLTLYIDLGATIIYMSSIVKILFAVDRERERERGNQLWAMEFSVWQRKQIEKHLVRTKAWVISRCWLSSDLCAVISLRASIPCGTTTLTHEDHEHIHQLAQLTSPRFYLVRNTVCLPCNGGCCKNTWEPPSKGFLVHYVFLHHLHVFQCIIKWPKSLY